MKMCPLRAELILANGYTDEHTAANSRS